MYYIFYCEDVPNSNALEKRLSVRPAHLMRMEPLIEAGRLLTAGPILDDDNEGQVKGSLIIADFPTLGDAKAWIAADPYATAEIYGRITVTPYKVVFPSE